MKNRAVFLDRDGVVIEHKHHLTKIREVRFVKGAASAIKLLSKNFKVIIISNQSVVARGLATKKQVEKINSFIKKQMQKKDAKIDAIYFCPHHPDFTAECDCRKPKIGLLLKAKKKFNLDFKKSYFIGDSTTDILTGKNAKCKTILVKTGYSGKDGLHKVKPTIVAKNILNAAQIIQKAKFAFLSVPNRL